MFPGALASREQSTHFADICRRPSLQGTARSLGDWTRRAMPKRAETRALTQHDNDGCDEDGEAMGSAGALAGDGCLSQAAKRRQLERRNTEEQVKRIISRKLGHFDAHVIKTQTNARGQTVYMWIRDQVKSKQNINGRLSTQVWTQFWREFDLSGDIAERLPVPPEGANETVDEELIEGLWAARHANPAERSPVALTRYLEKAPKMSETSLYGLLQAIQIGPNLSRAHAMKLQVATLQYFARCACLCMYTCARLCRGERAWASAFGKWYHGPTPAAALVLSTRCGSPSRYIGYGSEGFCGV